MQLWIGMTGYDNLLDFNAAKTLPEDKMEGINFNYYFRQTLTKLDCVQLWNVQKIPLSNIRHMHFAFIIDQNVIFAIIKSDLEESFYLIFGQIDLMKKIMTGYFIYKPINAIKSYGFHTGKWGKVVAEFYEAIDNFVPLEYKNPDVSVFKDEVTTVKHNIRLILTHKYCHEDNNGCYKNEIFA